MIIELIAVICIANTAYSTPHCDHTPVLSFQTMTGCRRTLYNESSAHRLGTAFVVVYCKERARRSL